MILEEHYIKRIRKDRSFEEYQSGLLEIFGWIPKCVIEFPPNGIWYDDRDITMHISDSFEIFEWLQINCQGRFITTGFIWFEDSNDAIQFKLTWL